MLKTYCVQDLIEVGMDEAGRGPMFGRVYVAGVIIPPDETFSQEFIKDSKMWSTKFIPENYKRPIKLAFNLIDSKTNKKFYIK